MSCSTTAWIEKEFVNSDFNDHRLTSRFKNILLAMSKKAQQTIGSTFNSWGDTKACYRFIGNEKVTNEIMLSSHKNETINRILQEKTKILLIQDTTYFDYNARAKTSGLDSVMRQSKSGEAIKGLMLHNTMAITTSGIPLGIIDQRYIDRKEFHEKESRKFRYCNNPIELKESFRWIQVIQDAHGFMPEKKDVVHVADREADIYELYRDVADLNEHFIIRASVNRSINKEKRREAPKEKLFDKLETMKAQGKISIKLQVNNKKKFRTANLSIIYTSVSIPPPPNKTMTKDGKHLPFVTVQAIMAIERNPPKLVKPIKWLIITNLEIGNIEQAIEKVTWYSYRWNIEIFHKILKSGCSVEKVQLRNAERLKKYITLKSIVAWRIFWLTRVLNKFENQSCDLVLSEKEWHILYQKINKKKPSKIPPTVKEVYYWIAKLGGYIGRKSDSPPGIISIWRGWTRLMDAIEDYYDFCG
ncbi:MAG: IS4 family transposase [Gammaproteobacteria bacterium]